MTHPERGLKPASAALIAAVIFLSACSSWARVETETSSTPARPERLRVVRNDGALIVLDNTRFSGDTLIGDQRLPADPQTASAEEWARGYRLQTVTIPFSAINTVERRQFSGPRTVMVVIGTIVGAYIGLLAMFLAG